jgi:hypothetical protein
MNIRHRLGSLPSTEWTKAAFQVLSDLGRTQDPAAQLAGLALAYWTALEQAGLDGQEMVSLVRNLQSHSMVDTHVHLRAFKDYARDVFRPRFT